MTPAIARTLLAGIAVAGSSAAADENVLHSFREYPAPGGKAPVVLVLSGQTGPGHYGALAGEIAASGFHVVLLDANEFRGKGPVGGASLIRGAIARAQRSPGALPGKAALVGYSLGGAAALSASRTLPDEVSAVVTHYGATSHITDLAEYAEGIRVPALVLVGGLDTYNRCCLAETARKLEAAAARAGKNMLEVVEYPDANHGWNINFGWHGATAADSFKRTIAHLKAHAPR